MARHSAPGDPEPVNRDFDLTAMFADDELLDRIGRGPGSRVDLFADTAPAAGHAPDDPQPVEALLGEWTAALRLDELPPQPALGRADWALRRGQHRNFRPMAAAAAAIFVLLLGTAGIGSRASQPGDALWPLAKVLWSEQADSAVARQSAQHALTQAREALSVGRLTSASQALTLVPPQLPKVLPQDGHDQIEATYRSLSSRVSSVLSASSESSTAASIDPGSAVSSRDSRIPSRVTRTVVVSGTTVVQTVTVTPPVSVPSSAPTRTTGSVRPTSPGRSTPPNGPISSPQSPETATPATTDPDTPEATTFPPSDTPTSGTPATELPATDTPITQPPASEPAVTTEQPGTSEESVVPPTTDDPQEDPSTQSSTSTDDTSPAQTTSPATTTETPNLDVTSGEPTEIVPASVAGE